MRLDYLTDNTIEWLTNVIKMDFFDPFFAIKSAKVLAKNSPFGGYFGVINRGGWSRKL